MAARKTSKRKTRRTSKARRTKRSSQTRKSRRTSRKAPSRARTLATGLSTDRKLDITGVALAGVGLLTLLSLISSSRSSLTGAWVSFLGQAVGWGLYLLPIALIALGIWLVIRHFERAPMISVERIFGVVLLFLGILVSLHLVLNPGNRAEALLLAEAGKGGGIVGGTIYTLLINALGRLGAGITLLAWILIALGMALDLSIAELFRWLGPLANRVLTAWESFLARLNEATRSRRPPEQLPNVSGQPQRPATASVNAPAGGAAATATGQVSPGLPPASIPHLAEPGAEAQSVAWVLPPIEQVLDPGGEIRFDEEFDRQRARLIEETLASFGAPAQVVEINRGPTITQYGVEPDFIETRNGRTRVRVGKIASLADDLALALAASRIRVQAPVPGKGFVGIEVPNEEIALVALRDVIESTAFQRLNSPLRFALGQNVAGSAVAADLAAMPHLLIAGATGSGKSVSVNALICCLLLHNTPNDLRILMVDPKRVELTGYNGIPHLLAPVVVELDRVVGSLQWVAREMDQRYHKLAKAGTRHIRDYNDYLEGRGEPRLPYLLVIIDELADLMMLAPDETERTITRLAQLARATGIHLVISTQRPSVDVVTGLIKANFPARVAFAVASGVDSRVILDQLGAERLLGSGDMLFQPPDAPAPVRLQGVFVSEAEIQRLVYYWRSQAGTAPKTPTAEGGVVDAPPPGIPLKQMPMWEEMEPEEDLDPLLDEAIDLIRREGKVSISMLQRRLRIGYTRAARLVETMEDKGIVSEPMPGSQAREVLDYGPAAPPVDD